MTEFAGRLALVTGGAGGIGAAVVKAFIDRGAKVAVADLDPSAAARQAAACNAPDRAFGYGVDVAALDSCTALAGRIGRDLGPVSVLVNGAGIAAHTPLDADDARAVWDRQIAINLTGVFNMCKAFAPALRQTKGSVVNIASMVAFQSITSSYGYVASKAGVRALTQTLAKELAVDGVRVNAVAPGVINTKMTEVRRADEKVMGEMMLRLPLKRTGEPAEVAEPIVFLASAAASYITGVTLPIDGGFTAV